MTKMGVKKKKRPESVAVNGNEFYLKDSDGVVWHIIRTPYKEIPVKVLNWDTVLP